jgi:hypothetical protein
MYKQLAVGVLIGAAVVGGLWATTRSMSSASSRIRPHDEPYMLVNYSILTSKTQATEAWEDGVMEKVVAIDFHPGWIVVQTEQGAGQVFFPERTRYLRWTSSNSGMRFK